MQITRTDTESVLTITGSEVPPGTYDLIIESYDNLGTVKSTLKKDSITIKIDTSSEKDSNKI